MIRRVFGAAWLSSLLLLAACGGGGGGGGPSTVAVPNVIGLAQANAVAAITAAGLTSGAVTTQASSTVAAGSVISQNPAANSSVAPGSAVNLVVSTGAAAANTLSVIIDAGPAAIPASQRVANVPYATVTLCTPGSTTACQTIDHVEVDTGSIGLQILAETLNGSAVPRPIIDPASNSPLRECVQFADGYSWGSMVVVDVTIGQRRIGSLPVHIIGDTATSGQAPTSCVQGPPENTVAQFGANGILGVGYWLQDCGTFCKTNAPSGLYYVCPNGTCTPTTVDLPDQAQNPIAQFASDANGVVIDLPRVAAPGAATVQGTMYFGIGTQANNGIGSATLYTVDGNGELSTVFNGLNYNKSFIDSGSNGFFFSSSLTQCTQSTGFYCPTNSVQESATLTGRNGNAATISFTVDNADSLIAVTPSLFAFPNLAGSNAGATGLSSSFDWGLPFFFGRKVYVLFENGTINGTSGPASAF